MEKKFAPVLISTLNRYEHFRRCLESLERCTGAELTDVYVGLDYPPSEKYVAGWEKIDAYLKEKESGHSFKNLYVRKRDHNCGPSGNMKLLYDDVRDISDRYISIEDDNELSPCFIEYMNNALEKYKDDDRVICVSGYTPFTYLGGKNIYFNRLVYTWGVGRWFKKGEESKPYRTLEFMKSVLCDFSKSMYLFKFHPIVFKRFMDQIVYNHIYGDLSFTCYCILNDKFCIYPSKTLVRNWGNDGSGVHCKVVDSYVKRELCQDKTFELDDIKVREEHEIRELTKKDDQQKWYEEIAIFSRYMIWRMTKIDIFSVRKIGRKNTK